MTVMALRSRNKQSPDLIFVMIYLICLTVWQLTSKEQQCEELFCSPWLNILIYLINGVLCLFKQIIKKCVANFIS